MAARSLDAESIAVELGQNALAIREGFLPASAIAELAQSAHAAHAQGRFARASVGASDRKQVEASVRGDSTLWLDPAGASAAEQAYFDAMEELRSGVNACLQLGAFELEAHYALYPPGAAYARHRDRPRGSDARVVSTVLYLNEEWDERDGGALRIYLDGVEGPEAAQAAMQTREVFPRAGVFVAFLSEAFEHEVLPATRERWSITAWLRRR